MMLGAQNEIQTIKQSFQSAVAQSDLPSACSIADIMQQKSIDLSFMEQLALLEELSKNDPDIGYRILNCGVFSQAMIFVGMTCLSNFKSERSPYTIPVVEQQLIKAVEEKRVPDVSLILTTAKWCIDSTLKTWAHNKVNGVENPYDEVQGIKYVNKTYLPQLATSTQRAAQPIIINTNNEIKKPTNQRRLTH
jgi:hypothetical protein